MANKGGDNLFCDNLKYHRDRANMTQRELADKVGVAQATIAQYERGTKQPTPPILIELSSIFDVTIDELVKGKDTA